MMFEIVGFIPKLFLISSMHPSSIRKLLTPIRRRRKVLFQIESLYVYVLRCIYPPKKWQISKENKTFFKVSVLFPPTQRHSTKRSYGIWKYKCLWTESTYYKNPSNIPIWRYGFVVCQKLQSNHSHFKLNKEYADYLLFIDTGLPALSM